MRIYPREGQVFYHGTSPEAAARILVEGLRLNGGGWSYLSPQYSIAKRFGKGAVLAIRVSSDTPLSAFEDCEQWEVLCWAHIPPERIQRTIAPIAAESCRAS